MNQQPQLRHIDYYNYYSKKIDDLDHYIRQQARKGHGRRKIREQSHRLFRNGLRPNGVHDYHNLQWDPSVYRGRTFRDFREKNLSINDSTVNFNKYCCFGCTGSRFTPVNRRKMSVGLPRMKVGGVFRPSTDDILFEESSGRKRHKQVDQRKEMEPFIVEQLEPPKYSENGTQSDEIKMAPRKKCQPLAIGTSTASQANICIVGTENHEDPMAPIMLEMGSKVLEQSLLETFEEYELNSIRSEIRILMQKRRNREARERKQAEDQLKKAERIELQKVQREKELQIELDACEKTAAIVYSINVCNTVLTQAISSLRQQSFLSDDSRDIKLINPWLHRQMFRHLQVPRMVVNDIIRTVQDDKLTEFNLGTLLSAADKLKSDEVDGEGEPEDFSKLGAPPNTASTIPYSTSEEEEN